mgnify:CR=1 FL=1
MNLQMSLHKHMLGNVQYHFYASFDSTVTWQDKVRIDAGVGKCHITNILENKNNYYRQMNLSPIHLNFSHFNDSETLRPLV